MWKYHNISQTVYKADCIIGLGSYDLRVAEKCSALFKAGVAPILLFSGKSGNWTKDKWKETEAVIFSRRAIELGVPPKKIRLEEKATNIGENIEFSRSLLSTNNKTLKKVIFVTKPNSTRRVLAACTKKWPEITCIVTSPEFKDLENQLTEEITFENLVNEIVGDTQRMVIYSYLGFQTEQKLTKEVTAAYNYLINRGYTKHLQPLSFEKDKNELPREEVLRRVDQLGSSYENSQ